MIAPLLDLVCGRDRVLGCRKGSHRAGKRLAWHPAVALADGQVCSQDRHAALKVRGAECVVDAEAAETAGQLPEVVVGKRMAGLAAVEMRCLAARQEEVPRAR